MRRTSFLGLHGGLVFKIAQDRRGTPEPVTVRSWIFANQAAFSYAYRVGNSSGKGLFETCVEHPVIAKIVMNSRKVFITPPKESLSGKITLKIPVLLLNS